MMQEEAHKRGSKERGDMPGDAWQGGYGTGILGRSAWDLGIRKEGV